MKRTAMAIGVTAVVLLVAAQLVLPPIAERRVRKQLDRVAVVSDVEVDSFPAVKLLFGEIDSLVARLEQADSDGSGLAELIARTEKIDRLRIDAGSVRLSGLEVTDARFVKDAERLHAEATLTRAQVETALPPGAEVARISSLDGALLVDGSFEAFGFRVAGPARVAPRDGAVVLTPDGGLLGGLAQVILFRDDRVGVTALAARERGEAIRVAADGRLAAG